MVEVGKHTCELKSQEGDLDSVIQKITIKIKDDPNKSEKTFFESQIKSEGPFNVLIF